MEDQLFQLISAFGPLSDALKNDIKSKLKNKKYKKNEHVLEEGQICNHLYFVCSGLLRAYYETNDRIFSNWFMSEKDFFVSVYSFYSRKPSTETIEVLEDCELLYIHYDDLNWLYSEHLEFNIIGRRLTEHYYSECELRSKIARNYSAMAKYDLLMEHYPDIFNRIPLHLVASFIGMSKETLSRLRSRQ